MYKYDSNWNSIGTGRDADDVEMSALMALPIASLPKLRSPSSTISTLKAFADYEIPTMMI